MTQPRERMVPGWPPEQGSHCPTTTGMIQSQTMSMIMRSAEQFGLTATGQMTSESRILNGLILTALKVKFHSGRNTSLKVELFVRGMLTHQRKFL